MKRTTQPAKQITFILGKPVRATTIFPEVFERLRGAGMHLTTLVPSGGDPLSDSLGTEDLIVQRGLSPVFLSRVRQIESAGTPHCNPVEATITVADRTWTAQQLTSHGLPVPRTAEAATWPQALELAEGRPSVVKATDGWVGRGSGVLIAVDGELPAQPPFDGPYVIQEFIPNDGETLKLYVAGHQVRGLIKHYTATRSTTPRGVPFAVAPALISLAQEVGTALGLEIYGLDVLNGPAGPVVVDVNPFPGFRGVPDAAQLVAEHLLSIVT